MHPRDGNGLETLDPRHIGDAVAAIRAEVPGIEVGVPSARWVEPDPQRRAAAVLAWGQLGVGKPDVVAVNVHDQGWLEVCAAASSVGIGIELGVWTSGDAVSLRAARLPERTVRVVAESTVGKEAAVAEAVRIVRALGPLPVPILLHGEETGAWPVVEYALRNRIDTRIGFEDVLQRRDGWLATGNDDLVISAVSLRV